MVYSRRKTIEEKRNRKRASVFFFLTITSIILLFFYGLPIAIKYAAFLADIRKSSQPVELNDNTPPPPPFFEPLPSYTKSESVEIKGQTEPGATVKIFIDKKSEELLANNEGRFNLAIKLTVGLNEITAIAIDTYGNESQQSEIEIILDKDAPKIELIKPEDGKVFFGPKQRQIVIEGATDIDAKLSINGRWVVVESDGKFTYTTTLNEGDNQFIISAEDNAGNSTEKIINVKFTP